MNRPMSRQAPIADPPSPGAAALNPETLAAIRALQQPGLPSLLGKVITVYLGEGPELLRRIRVALAAADLDAVGDAAHDLKSISANLGADRLADLCRRLETMDAAVASDAAPPLVERIGRELGDTLSALRAVLREQALG